MESQEKVTPSILGSTRLRPTDFTPRTMVLGRQSDSERPQACKTHQNVPREVPGTPLAALLWSNAAQTPLGSAQVFLVFLLEKC